MYTDWTQAMKLSSSSWDFPRVQNFGVGGVVAPSIVVALEAVAVNAAAHFTVSFSDLGGAL